MVLDSCDFDIFPSVPTSLILADMGIIARDRYINYMCKNLQVSSATGLHVAGGWFSAYAFSKDRYIRVICNRQSTCPTQCAPDELFIIEESWYVLIYVFINNTENVSARTG